MERCSPATKDFVTRVPDNVPVYISTKLDFSTAFARVPCGKQFVKRGERGLYKSSEKGKELLAGRRTRQHEQRQCQAGGQLWKTALCRPR